MPDHTVEQGNHINDYGFSTASTSKTIVPTQGSVYVFAFVESEPLGQLSFAWCGDRKAADRVDKATKKQPNKQEYYCSWDRKASADSTAEVKNVPGFGTGEVPWKINKFKNWKPAALEMLKEHTFVIVGGVHIREVSSKEITLTSLNCPGKNDVLDLSAAVGGDVKCAPIGMNLSALKSLSIECTSSRVDGVVSENVAGSSAAVIFPVASLAKLSGICKVFITDNTGRKTDSGLMIGAPAPPTIAGVQPGSLTLGVAGSQHKITVTGSNLSGIHTLILKPENGNAISLVADPGGSDSSTDFTLKDDAVRSSAGQPLKVEFTTLSDEAKGVGTGMTISVISANTTTPSGTTKGPAKSVKTNKRK